LWGEIARHWGESHKKKLSRGVKRKVRTKLFFQLQTHRAGVAKRTAPPVLINRTTTKNEEPAIPRVKKSDEVQDAGPSMSV